MGGYAGAARLKKTTGKHVNGETKKEASGKMGRDDLNLTGAKTENSLFVPASSLCTHASSRFTLTAYKASFYFLCFNQMISD